MKAMTFTTATDAQTERFLTDPRWAVEQKLDGVRCLVSMRDGEVRLLNRNGNELNGSSKALRDPIIREFDNLTLLGRWTFDGELMEDGTLWVFDMIEGAKGFVNPRTEFRVRREALEMFAEMFGWDDGLIRVVPQVVDQPGKLTLIEAVAAGGGEGVMLKSLDASYREGRTKTAGFKVKFTKDIDCVVIEDGFEGRDNRRLGLYDGGKLVEVGRCSTIGKKHADPGDVVEVRFLYVTDDGRLYQPRQMRVRHDKRGWECDLTQLNDLRTNRKVVA